MSKSFYWSDEAELVDTVEVELAAGVVRCPRKQRIEDVEVALVRGLPHHPCLFEQVLAERRPAMDRRVVHTWMRRV